MQNTNPGRGAVRTLGLAAAAIFALAAASHQRAEALSLASPGTAPAAKYTTDGLTTEVRHGGGGHGGGFHGGGGFRGGGAAFHGGGFRGGGAAFHGGGFRGGGAAFHGGGIRSGAVGFRGGGYRAGPVFHRGYRYGGYRYAYHRPHFFHRRHFHRRFYYAPSYYYYAPRYCRVIWTYYGPRKICRYRPWYRHHYWRHRWHPYRYW
jgi:hypothetical protein